MPQAPRIAEKAHYVRHAGHAPFLTQRMHGNVRRKCMRTFKKADDMYALEPCGKFLYPSVEKSKDRVRRVHGLRHDKETHPVRNRARALRARRALGRAISNGAHDNALSARLFSALKSSRSVYASEKLKVFARLCQERDVLFLRGLEECGTRRLFHHVSVVARERSHVFDKTKTTRASTSLVHRVAVPIADQRIAFDRALDGPPVGSLMLRQIVHEIECEDLHIAADVVRIFYQFRFFARAEHPRRRLFHDREREFRCLFVCDAL